MPTGIEKCFATVETAAANGQRCPVNGVPFIRTNYLLQLVDEGKLRLHFYAENFRVAEILTGPHAGKKTALPDHPATLWKVVDATGAHRIKPEPVQPTLRCAPSLPVFKFKEALT